MNKELQQKYMELQLIDQQAKQVQQHLINLNQQLAELKNLEDGLDSIKKVKSGTEIFVPLGSGVFAKAELKDTDKILMNVGANILTSKGIPASKEIVKKQVDEIQGLVSQMEQELHNIMVYSQGLQQDIASEIKEEKQ